MTQDQNLASWLVVSLNCAVEGTLTGTEQNQNIYLPNEVYMLFQQDITLHALCAVQYVLKAVQLLSYPACDLQIFPHRICMEHVGTIPKLYF